MEFSDKMKKFLLLIFVLTTSLLCTACINNLAIQELNQIGKNYLDKGDFDNAIARFQSGVDLNENVFETRYNLGVAYIKKEDYKNAIEQLKYAVEINPASAEAYYSYAVALESDGLQFESNPFDDTAGDENKKEFSSEEIALMIEEVKEAVKMYREYLKLSPESNDREQVEFHITELENTIEQKEMTAAPDGAKNE